jgi:Family of unknown function (DUF6082)
MSAQIHSRHAANPQVGTMSRNEIHDREPSQIAQRPPAHRRLSRRCHVRQTWTMDTVEFTHSRFLRARTLVLTVVAVAMVAAATALVLFSPLFLEQLNHIHGVPWVRLSDIGQTYGVASASLSAIALIGVSLSLIIQARQARAERIRAVRERQMDLLNIVLSDPATYGPVMGRHRIASAEDVRRGLFATMLMNYARMGYQLGIITETALREEHFKLAFGNEPVRAWWVASRSYWVIGASTWRERKFVQIADEEYRKAITEISKTGEMKASSTASGIRVHKTRSWQIPASLALGIAIGALARSRMSRARH